MKRSCFLLSFLIAVVSYGQQAERLPGNFLADDMALIKGGSFIMGSPANETGRNSNEGPLRQVTVSSFFIGRFPVTQSEYEKVMGKNPSHHDGLNLPVEQVSWFDAIEYCNRRSAMEGFTQAYAVSGNTVTWNRAANGYRLPTEAEWEFACRAGTRTPFYRGDSVNDAGWHVGNSGKQAQAVGQKLPNDWGLYDMHGNVLEWCWDLLGEYTAEAQTDPQGAVSGTHRVYRGGSWAFQPHLTRSAYRFGNNPNMTSYFVGFRVARNGF